MSNASPPLDEFESALAVRIDDGSLLSRGQTVVTAVSGGRDSVALLHALARLAEQPNRAYRVLVAHLDHGLRAESVDEADFVRALAEELRLPFHGERVDVSGMATALGEGTEHAAREARYEFLARTARAQGAGAVALAHHADDNVETILFRALRGTGLRGLAGMPAHRPIDGARPVVRLVRPMLSLPRTTVEGYCRRRSLRWRDDPSNEQSVYRRNFLRNELLPTIRAELNPKVDEALLRLAEFAGRADDLVRTQAERLLRRATVKHGSGGRVLSPGKLLAADAILRTTAIRLALEHLGVPQRDLSAERIADIEQLLSADGGAVNLPGGFVARRDRSGVCIAPES